MLIASAMLASNAGDGLPSQCVSFRAARIAAAISSAPGLPTYRHKRNWSAASNRLLQFRVLGLGLLEDGDIGVGVFPQGEEILVRGACFGRVARQNVRSADLQVCQRA